MKEIINDYIKEIKYFVTNKKYMICLIIVALLSYGFTITHYSIGIDDLCFDRYVNGTYMLSSNRWGTWLLYNLLQIHSFSPFWLDFLVTIVIISIAILISAFIRKNFKENKFDIIGYIIFSCILISYPIIFYSFMYQVTSLSVAISNLLIIISAILFYENYFNGNNKILINIIVIVLATFSISSYQACIETYLLIMFLEIFSKLNKNEKNETKEIIKFFLYNIVIILTSLIIYFLVSYLIIIILKNKNLLKGNFSANVIIWKKLFFQKMSIIEKVKYIVETNKKIISGLYIYNIFMKLETIFLLFIIIRETIKSIKEKNLLIVLSVIGMFVSIISLGLVQGYFISRTQFTWAISTALIWFYIYRISSNKKILRDIITLLAIYVVLNQTYLMSKAFYNEYRRFEHERDIAIDIGINITKYYDYKNKEVAYVGINAENNRNGQVFKWGQNAFDEYDYEITKFINYFGFNLIPMNPNNNDELEQIYAQMNEEQKNQTIIETDKYILVNMKKYNLK